ncbi:MAG: Thrombospondin type 3 repeat superfamily protein [Candidatus Moranbacteria bacterium GW2011_GWE2_47_10]|nr:MAG: Thrombospondin type 3 repeat superfamily protein [Candidatus Moranbacteria bacterium GW2011_GWE2_47_10]HBP00849.1 hypothetical protein [Candidatus Moranbacteria bacterium]
MKQKPIKKLSIGFLSLVAFAFAALVVANTANKLVFSDLDQDGLSDEEEKVYGTDPSKKDTDRDGYSDGTEVKSGYDPLKPAPGDKLVGDKSLVAAGASAAQGTGLTQKFTEDFQQLLTTKDKQSLTVEDLDDFVNESLGEKMTGVSSINDLPQVDRASVKIKKQDYASLGDEERLRREKGDYDEYLTGMFYAFINNAPQQITSEKDLENFYENFENQLVTLSTASPNAQYFRQLGSKTEGFIGEVQGLEVPESIADIHVKFLRILKGFVALQDPSLPSIEDPITRFIILSKASKLKDVAADFFNTDVANYHQRFDSLR